VAEHTPADGPAVRLDSIDDALTALKAGQVVIVVDDEDVVPENLDSIDSLVAFVSGKLGGTVPAG